MKGFIRRKREQENRFKNDIANETRLTISQRNHEGINIKHIKPQRRLLCIV